MSSPEKEPSLLAGHPPAVKAGGMRITQHKPQSSGEKPTERRPSDEDEEYEQVESSSPPKAKQIISGVVVKGDADFPAEAVQAFHNKPMPAHEYRSAASSKPNIIQQPRKQ